MQVQIYGLNLKETLINYKKMQKMRFNASQKIHIFGPFPSKICFAELAQQKNLYTKNLSKIREFFYCEEFIRLS